MLHFRDNFIYGKMSMCQMECSLYSVCTEWTNVSSKNKEEKKTFVSR